MGKQLVITGYKNIKFSERIGTYELQLNPSEIKIKIGDISSDGIKDKGAGGNEISSKPPIYRQRTLDIIFTIDNTGAVPNKPDGMGFFGSGNLLDSIKTLEKIAIDEVHSEHRPPYVRISWGPDFSFLGSVSSYNYDYTFFNADGTPLRANITLKIVDFDTNEKPLNQSPDITKMPIIKDGDTIVKLSEEYYDDKKYYIKLAEFNGLSSIRSLKNGNQLEIPPIK